MVHTSGTLQIRSDFDGSHAKLRRAARDGLAQRGALRDGRLGHGWTSTATAFAIVTNWVADTGTTPVGRIQIGDTAAKTFTANFDTVIVDAAAG